MCILFSVCLEQMSGECAIGGELLRTCATRNCFTVRLSTETVSVLVSGVVLAISTAIVTSIIVWCVMRRAAQRPSSPADDEGVTTHELAPVIYDTPVINEHNDQSISTQDNVAYGGTIPLKQNEAYERQIHIN